MAGSLEDMIKSAIILPDVHLTDVLPKDYLPVREFIKDFKPNKIILLGDFMDIASLSAWDMDKKRLMEGRRINKELTIANKELDFLQSNVKDKDKGVIYIEGNHEDRVTRYIDSHPEMEGMIELPDKLDLKKRGVEWIKLNKLFKLGDMYFTHGMYTNQYSAAKHLQKLGCNVTYGHQHGTQTFMQNMAMQKPHMAYALGTLGDKAPDYMKGKPGNWINQFAVFYWDTTTGHFNLYPVNVIGSGFFWNGKKYSAKK
jgi:metallophosphoesterase superfamily enzyme